MPTLVDRSETLAVEVACSADALTVVLDDGRTVAVTGCEERQIP